MRWGLVISASAPVAAERVWLRARVASEGAVGQPACSWCCWSAHLGVAVTRLGVWLSSQGVVHCGRCPAGHQVLLQQTDWCTHLTGVLTSLQCRMPVSVTSGHLAPARFRLLSRCVVVQLWKLPSLTPGLVLRGHKRGVWAVAFAPVDRVRPPVPQPNLCLCINVSCSS